MCDLDARRRHPKQHEKIFNRSLNQPYSHSGQAKSQVEKLLMMNYLWLAEAGGKRLFKSPFPVSLVFHDLSDDRTAFISDMKEVGAGGHRAEVQRYVRLAFPACVDGFT